MIKIGKYEMKGEEWEKISEGAKDLIRRLLVVDKEKRITIEDALMHPWIRKY